MLVFSWISGDQFLVWGWRIPFLLSIIMVAVGIYIRLGVLETPVFAEMVEKERLAASPVLEVLKRQPKEVILSAFVRMGEQGPGFVYIAFIFTYGTRVLGVSRDLLLSGMVTAAVLGFLWVPVAGHLSDRIGRRRMYIIGAIFSAIYGFIYFALLDTRSPTLIFIAVALSLLPVMTLYGPQAALIAESFAPRLRYSGAGLGYQLASIIAGGPAPFIATALLAAYGSGYAVAMYIVACCVPKISGIEACRAIKEVAPSAKIVMLTISDEEEDLFEAIRAGASGYLLKDIPLDEVADAVRSVHGGQSLINPSMAGKLLSEFATLAKRDSEEERVQHVAAPKLTDREMEVLKLVARGMNNRDIAKELFISENTVKNHVRNILEKLQIHSRMEAVMIAVRQKLIEFS